MKNVAVRTLVLINIFFGIQPIVYAQDTLTAMSVPKTLQRGTNKIGDLAIQSTMTNIANGKKENGKTPREIIAAELKSSSVLTKREFGILNDGYDPKDGPLQGIVDAQDPDNRPSLGKIYGYSSHEAIPKPDQLGVDDEIMKTSMAMYQPLHRVQLDYLNDQNARNRYLDQALTKRGVLILAFGFLDKTLGTGLTDIQQQADMNSTQTILQQVNWSLERMASPDRAQAFKDTDEKLEACLEIAIKEGQPKADIKGLTRERVDFNCPQTACGPVPTGNKYVGTDYNDQSKHGNGSYAYCVCCAQYKTQLNGLEEKKILKPIGTNGLDERTWSLVDRSFWGVSTPDQRNKDTNKGLLNDHIAIFKELFGDYTLKEETGKGESMISSRYQTPQISIRKFVALHKNRCHFPGGQEPKADLETAGDCGLDEQNKFSIHYGICPSIMSILMNWESVLNGTKPADFDRKMAEASMGQPLYGAIVEGILAMVSNTDKKLETKDEALKAASVIEAFCNTSAISAVVRHIAFYKMMTNDALMYNTVVTQREKAILNQLIDKYFEAIRLADLDEQSKYRTYGIVQGIGMNRDRGLMQSLASSSQAQSNLIANTTNATNLTSFISGGLINANGGGTAGIARTRSDLSSALTGKSAEIVRESEEKAVELDPLNNGVLGRYAKSIGKTVP